VSAQASTSLFVSEVHPGGSGNGSHNADPAVAGLTASQVVIYVAGRDEDCRRNGADDDRDNAGPVAVHIGAQNTVHANIVASRGTVWLKSRTRATGAFIGVHVRVGVNAQLTLDSAFR
jgi:hypothetical protein